jgi:hypothetical protein
VLGTVKVTNSEFTLQDNDGDDFNNGRIIIKDGGTVEFDISSRILLATEGAVHDGSNFEVGFRVAASNSLDTATKATVVKTDATDSTPALWTVTSGGDGSDLSSAPIVLGQTTVAFNGTNNVDAECKIYTQAGVSAAAGSIKAASGTAIVLTAPEAEE